VCSIGSFRKRKKSSPKPEVGGLWKNSAWPDRCIDPYLTPIGGNILAVAMGAAKKFIVYMLISAASWSVIFSSPLFSSRSMPIGEIVPP